MEIKKLEDIVAWVDGKIRDGGYNEEKYRSDATTAYCNVKAHELWRIRDVALESIERHAVYTNALNEDIAYKAAKIELMQKEIEGRKEGYHALKERLDHITALEEGWYANAQELVETCKSKNEEIEKLKKESEKWQDLAKMNRDTICDQYTVCEDFKKKIAELEEKVKHQRENLDGINKTLEIRTKENESLIKVRNNLNKEIEAHESENARLSEKIMELHGTITELSHDIDNYKSWNASLHKDIKELKKKEDDHGRKGFKEYIEWLVKEEEDKFKESWKTRLNEELEAIFKEEEETVKYRPSEIDRFTNFLKEEVDKKRVVDIRYGVEDDLHVTRDLLVAAVKLIVTKGYHEYDGVTTGYGRFHVLTAPDVEFKDLYDTWKIKSIGPDIPCGEDAIE